MLGFLGCRSLLEHEFQAYGMENITGILTQIGGGVIKKLFPSLTDNVIMMLRRKTKVDFLIGMQHPSWHPDKVERSNEVMYGCTEGSSAHVLADDIH